MEAFVYVAFLVPLPLLALCVLIGKVIAVAVTRRLMPKNLIAAWAEGSVLFLCTATIFYSLGVWSGHFFDLSATTEICTQKPLGVPPTSESAFPLRSLCHWGDGTTTDLVPAYVNPLVFTCLAAAVACAGMALRSARRNRPNRPDVVERSSGGA